MVQFVCFCISDHLLICILVWRVLQGELPAWQSYLVTANIVCTFHKPLAWLPATTFLPTDLLTLDYLHHILCTWRANSHTTYSVSWATYSVLWATYSVLWATYSVLWPTYSVLWATYSCGLPTQYCGLPTQYFGLLTQYCGLPTQYCGLPTQYCGLPIWWATYSVSLA